jgi:hypothetical protein
MLPKTQGWLYMLLAIAIVTTAMVGRKIWQNGTPWDVIYEGRAINEEAVNGDYGLRFDSGVVDLSEESGGIKGYEGVKSDIALIGAEQTVIKVAYFWENPSHVFVSSGMDSDGQIKEASLNLFEYQNFEIEPPKLHSFDCSNINGLATLYLNQDSTLDIQTDLARCLYDPVTKKVRKKFDYKEPEYQDEGCDFRTPPSYWKSRGIRQDLGDGCSFGVDLGAGTFNWSRADGTTTTLLPIRPTARRLNSKTRSSGYSRARWKTDYGVCSVHLTPNYLSFGEIHIWPGVGAPRRQRFIFFKNPIDIRQGCQN